MGAQYVRDGSRLAAVSAVPVVDDLFVVHEIAPVVDYSVGSVDHVAVVAEIAHPIQVVGDLFVMTVAHFAAVLLAVAAVQFQYAETVVAVVHIVADLIVASAAACVVVTVH